MIITAQQILYPDRKDLNFWLFESIMHSITPEIIDEARKEDDTFEYDVKLQINGHTVEPKLLSLLMSNMEKYIDMEAEKIASNKLSEALHDINTLNEIIRDAEYKIRDKFNIPKEETDY